MEAIGIYIAAGSVIAALTGFFLGLKANQAKTHELLQRQGQLLDEISKRSFTEHEGLMKANHEGRKEQMAEHKEMIQLLQGIREPLIAHIAIDKERARRGTE